MRRLKAARQLDFGEIEHTFNILDFKRRIDIKMDVDEQQVFSEFIQKHQHKLKGVDIDSIARNEEERLWLQLFRIFSEETKDRFRRGVKIKELPELNAS